MKKLIKWVLLCCVGLLLVLLIVAGVLYLVTDGEYTVEKTVMDDPSIPHITVNGVTLHAKAFGDPTSPVVIILHGGPGNDFRMLLHLQELADTFYVVFYDQRGTGLSERVPMERITLDSYFVDLNGVIDHFAPGRKVNLVGHSWGAMLATGFAAHNPDRVDKIVLGEPGFLTPPLAKEFGAMAQPKSMLKMIGGLGIALIKSLHVQGPDDQAWLDFFAAQLMTETDGDVTPIAKYFCNDDPKTASMPYWRLGASAIFAAQTHETNSNGEPMIDMVTGLDRWKGEALILAGECNRLIGPDWQQNNHLPLFSHARLVVISGAGHTLFGERPLESIAVTRAFLNGSLASDPNESEGSTSVAD